MTGYIMVENWDKLQHYKDRNPPWIKLYCSLLNDYEYCRLPDESKLLLMTLYMLASRYDNKIPCDPEWIAKQGSLKSPIDLKPLESGGFIKCYQGDSKAIELCKQHAEPETERETENKTHSSKTKQPHKARIRQYTPEFEQIWKEYPRHDGKGDAFDSFNLIKPDQALIAKMTQTIRMFCPEWKKKEKKYIPLLATWLNNGRWDDEPDSGNGETKWCFKHNQPGKTYNMEGPNHTKIWYCDVCHGGK